MQVLIELKDNKKNLKNKHKSRKRGYNIQKDKTKDGKHLKSNIQKENNLQKIKYINKIQAYANQRIVVASPIILLIFLMIKINKDRNLS